MVPDYGNKLSTVEAPITTRAAGDRDLNPAAHQPRVLHTMLDQVISRTNALAPLRATTGTVPHQHLAPVEVSTR